MAGRDESTGEQAGIAGLGMQSTAAGRRAHARYVAHWRAALIGEGFRHLGRTANVSLAGAAVLCDVNLPPGQELQLYLEVPAGEASPPVVLEVVAAVVHSTLTSQGFRLGLAFRSYVGDAQDVLRAVLASGRYRELSDPPAS